MGNHLTVKKHNAVGLLSSNGLDAYLSWINTIKPLSANEEHALLTDYKENQNIKAAKEVIMAHLSYVVYIASKFKGYGLEQVDLIQEGNKGLMEALRRFEPKKGVRFITYAIHWIKAEIHEFILKNRHIMRIATTKEQRKLFFKLRKLAPNLYTLSSEEIKHIAATLKVSVKSVRTMQQRMLSSFKSLDSAASPQNNVLSESKQNKLTEIIPDEVESSPIDQMMLAEQKTQLANALKELERNDERAYIIITARWLNDSSQTLQSLALKFNVSTERVRQIEKKGLVQLRKILSETLDTD